MNFPWDQLLVKGNWMITMAQIGAIPSYWFNRSNYFKLWKYLYKEWFTSVDHKNRFNVLNLCRTYVRSWY